MRKKEELLELVSEPILRAIENGSLTLEWNPDAQSKETWVMYGYPNRIVISQAIPDALVPLDIRHEIRHIVFGHIKHHCPKGVRPPCVETADEIEVNRFLTSEEVEAYKKTGIDLVSHTNPKVRSQFEGTPIPLDYIDAFPSEALHDALCKKQDGCENEHTTIHHIPHCSTLGKNSGGTTPEGLAATFLLAKTLVQAGYEDTDIRSCVSGGMGSGSKIWESSIKMKPPWADKVLTVLSPELGFERRRYAPKPLWGPLLLSNR